MLTRYPSIEPPSSTVALTDVNGVAGSLEMYLGVDVLTIDGTLAPVHLKTFMPAVQRHQGVLSEAHKVLVLKAFEKKVKAARSGRDSSGDWSGLRAIFEKIVHAFDWRTRSRVSGGRLRDGGDDALTPLDGATLTLCPRDGWPPGSRSLQQGQRASFGVHRAGRATEALSILLGGLVDGGRPALTRERDRPLGGDGHRGPRTGRSPSTTSHVRMRSSCVCGFPGAYERGD
ncbi:hypothetical protein [Streptomyces sp. enrichment culture]|uniref:hypothetical protein n=1 Tax=Streptomyces sp. enrichment culture TaxID=1795815 RepID=UPI003F55CA61